jgi:hypothetical protein
MEIQFKTKDQPEVRKINYDMPEGLQALVNKFGEDAVASAATGAFVISLQALARRHIEKSDAEIQELANAWDPNTRSSPVKQSPFERAAGALGKLSDEEKAELFNKLKAQLGS